MGGRYNLAPSEFKSMATGRIESEVVSQKSERPCITTRCRFRKPLRAREGFFTLE
jgi:hypothetical protein